MGHKRWLTLFWAILFLCRMGHLGIEFLPKISVFSICNVALHWVKKAVHSHFTLAATNAALRYSTLLDATRR
jgi:hypothetical protein